MSYGQVSEEEFEKMYEAVKAISRYGETSDGTNATDNLHDWMYEGDISDMDAEDIASEWDDMLDESAE